jgi:hypothetical protein
MRSPTPRQLVTLGIGHRDGLRCSGEAVPNVLEQLQTVRGAERENFLEYYAHVGIFRSSSSSCKPDLSTHSTRSGIAP